MFVGSRKKWLIVGFGILLIVLGWWRRDDLGRILGVGSFGKYQMFTTSRGGYSMSVPLKWKIEEAAEDKFVSRVVVSPIAGGFQAGNIGQMSITVIASPSASQPFSTREEFEEWRNKPVDVIKGTGVLKLANEVVAGKDAVRLAEVDIVEESIDQSFWSVTSWFFDNQVHYYVNMMGNGKLTQFELGILTEMLESLQIN